MTYRRQAATIPINAFLRDNKNANSNAGCQSSLAKLFQPSKQHSTPLSFEKNVKNSNRFPFENCLPNCQCTAVPKSLTGQ